MDTFRQKLDELSKKIQNAYESQVTIPEAEALAAEFLHAQLMIVDALKSQDLDARMKKAGLKSLRADIYMNEVKKSDKKPSDVMLDAIINSDNNVQELQQALDESEVERNFLQSHFDVFNNAHIFFRGISKGKFE